MKKILLLIGLICLVNPVFAQEENDFHLSEKVVIDSILLQGNKQTKDYILFRELSIAQGQKVRSDSLQNILQQNWHRLYTTGLFTDVTIKVDTVNMDHVIFNITVKERWYIIPEMSVQFADQSLGVWWTERNRDIRRAILGVTLVHKNFRGRRERLAFSTKFGYGREVGLSYLKPFIDKKQRMGVGFEVGYYDNKEVFHITDSNKLQRVHVSDKPIINRSWVSLLYTYRPAYAYTNYFKLSYRHNRVGDTVLKLNPEYYLNGSRQLNYMELNYRLDVNKVDNWAYPLIGTKIVTNVYAQMGFQGIKFFAFGTLEAGKYNHLGGKWYTSLIGRAKLSLPTNQPYVGRQGLGTKYEYVRGYEHYVIDGYQYGLLRANLKYEALNISFKNIGFKYLPVIPVRVYPKLFADVGYVWNPTPGNSFLNNRPLYSFGVGLDIFTAYDFKIRIEYALNHLGQKKLNLHFNAE